MGDFPYASSYMTNGAAELPPWPVLRACEALGGSLHDGLELMSGVCVCVCVSVCACVRRCARLSAPALMSLCTPVSLCLNDFAPC
jgi:hypothetical protein